MQGTKAFSIVGLPDASVKESKERITAALQTLGYTLANQKVIINLSPSELKKLVHFMIYPWPLGSHKYERNHVSSSIRINRFLRCIVLGW